MTDPRVQKFSIGLQRAVGRNWSVSSDYVHTRGSDEPRVLVINPFIRNVCDPAYPGSTPASPRCVRGANSRYFDQALVQAGFPVTGGRARVEQINSIGTNNSSRFDSWTTTLRGRTSWVQGSISYVLASSRAWGGQPVASYSGNGINITPEHCIDGFLEPGFVEPGGQRVRRQLVAHRPWCGRCVRKAARNALRRERQGAAADWQRDASLVACMDGGPGDAVRQRDADSLLRAIDHGPADLCALCIGLVK
jgi:hypothetical protein